VLRTVIGFFVKSPYDPEQVRSAIDAHGEGDVGPGDVWTGMLEDRVTWNRKHGLSLGGVRLPLLAPGESIETAAAGNHADDYDAFETAFLRNFAAASGQSYEEVSGDFRHTNYSSFRGATEQAWRTLKRRRGSFTPRYATPLYGAWLEEALDGHLKDLMPRNAPPFAEMRSAYARALWIGPGRGVIDPVKEPQGAVLQLDAGLTTLEETTRNISGMYYEDVLEQREVEEAAMKERGLSLPDWAGGKDMAAHEVAEKPQPQ
jgi:lambda family phage portal protein